MYKKEIKSKTMVYWVDGSSKNKYSICDSQGNAETIKLKKNHTCNEMEYIAVIEALKRANNGDSILSDSQLVVNQLRRDWKIKAKNLYKYWWEAFCLIERKFRNDASMRSQCACHHE